MEILPIANEYQCFGQRQGYCKNLATWRLVGKFLILHFCDECKARENIAMLAKDSDATWTELDTVTDGTTTEG